jgi:drug/metabolite transporter (DMT)-like permease
MSTAGIIFAILASVTWGLVYTIDQKILTSVSPLTWLAISTFVMVFLTLPVLLFNLEEVKTVFHSGRNNLLLILLSQILIFMASLFIFYAIKQLGAINANIFEITYPLFVVIFSLLIFGARISLAFGIGALLILVGSMVIIKWS